MALQLGALRDALIQAGAGAEKAGLAAEEVASYERRVSSLESTLNLHTWILGVNTAMLLALVLKNFL